MIGPREGPRIINGTEIIYGTRSACDMQRWRCNGCLTMNEAIRLLVFDVAPLHCCKCKLPNPNNFSFCLAYVKMNGIELIDEVKSQKPKERECASYSASHLVELINRILVGTSSEEPDKEKASLVMNPDFFAIPYKRQFPETRGGAHKIIHMLQRLTNGIGIRMHYKNDETRLAEEYFQGSEISMVHCDDFEEVCRQIADGNAVLAPLHVGANYPSLKYCEFYTAVRAEDVSQRRFPGHMVLLIGAMSEDNVRAYFALDSAGKAFCHQLGVDEGWVSVLCHGYKTGGISKINAESDFMFNFVKLSRPGDDALPHKRYDFLTFEGIENDQEDERFMIDLVLQRDPEDAVKLSSHNFFLAKHGPYFKPND